MPKGFDGVRKASADIEARKNAGGGEGRVRWFRLKPNESARVRFLEQGDDIAWAWMVTMPPRGNQKWGDDVPSLDQGDGTPCPALEAGMSKRFRGFINVIWRDAPIFKRNEQGRALENPDGSWVVDHTEDVVAVWNQGIMVFEELDGKDATYKGLCSRDFIVTRKGEGLNTKYVIEPADPDAGPVPMSDADKALAAGKPDLIPFITPPSEEDMRKLMQGIDPSQEGWTGTEVEGAQAETVNPFLAKRG